MNHLLKICGITTLNDAEMVLSFSETKPEYLGFVFFEKSVRYISPENAKKIVEKVRSIYEKKSKNSSTNASKRVKFVGVFVNENLNQTDIFEKYDFLDVFQLHGDNDFETPIFCLNLQKKINKLKSDIKIWKVFRVQNIADIENMSAYSMVETILVDAFSTVKNEYGGSGKQVCKNILPYLRSHISLHQKLFIAGGITAENKYEILSLSGADGIDLSSSVEISAGVKSKEKIKIFIDLS